MSVTGLIRFRPISRSDMGKIQEHNYREYAENNIPANINSDKMELNKYSDLENKTLLQIFDEVGEREELKETTNANIGAEYIVGLVGERRKEFYDYYYYSDSFLIFASKFIEEKHGEHNIISKVIHNDENNPHMHIIVMGEIIRKEQKWKNQNGEGVNVIKRRNVRCLKKDLEKLQTDYNEYIRLKVESYGNNADVPIVLKRGVPVSERKESYMKYTSHLLAPYTDKINELKVKIELNEITKLKAESEIKKIQKDIKDIVMGNKTNEQKHYRIMKNKPNPFNNNGFGK